MSTSIWGGPESYGDETYPSSLLKYLLKHMMAQFAAQGGCIALYDESIGQMRVRVHLRSRAASTNTGPNGVKLPSRRMTVHLENDPSPSSSPLLGWTRHSTQPLSLSHSPEELDEISSQQTELFAVNSTYPIGQGLIGYAWLKNEVYILRQEDFLALLHESYTIPAQAEGLPTWYLVVPIQESTLIDDVHGRKRQPSMLGVVVLYQFTSAVGQGFQQRQRAEALNYAERISLCLQNDRLQHSQRRTSDYLQRLQEVSTAFPTNVKLSDLVENVYRFTEQVVNVSSVLLTLYDRDTERIYDVFAIRNGVRIEGLTEQPVVSLQKDRPTWWQVTQKEKCTLLCSPAQDPQKANDYSELLTGVWGDQRHAESFLLLPLKMFNRVIGSLCLTSLRPNAYHAEEIQVLETMVQIVTVSIENAKLYDRDRLSLRNAKRRESQLAAMNSALQSISSVLNITELLNNFVESVAMLVNAEMCVFFQLSETKEELIAQALYALTSVRMVDDGSGLPTPSTPRDKTAHDDLINMIRLPFKDTMLEQLVNEGFFYLDPPRLEELAQKSAEGGAIFLQETQIQRMLMIPVSYQTKLVGILAVHTPKDRESRFFFPEEVGTLLAICAQAASAISNAQLFEQLRVAYAELERMDKLKDEFLVTASHELRTPLSAISGYSTLLKRQSARISPQHIQRYATKIAGAAQQLSDLVSSMTEAAKMSAVNEKLDLQIGPVQIRSAAEIAANMLSINIEQKITLFIDSDLWVSGDPLRVRQVMTNLLDNAAKYSPSEGHIQMTATAMTFSEVAALLPEEQIDHAFLAEQGHVPVVLVRVYDQGEGVLPEDQKKIFEKFVRASRSLTTPVRGSGLGLYICRRYIEAMNGKLVLERSIPNEGSVFSFCLPRVEAPIEPEEQDESEGTTA